MSTTQPTSNHNTSEGGARLNKLLSRQLRKYLDGNIPETGPLRDFILAVNDSYNHFEHDRVLLERSMDMSFSELKESNQKLVESEGMFYDMALNVPGMIYQFILRPDGSMSFLYVSPGSIDLVGLSPEVIVQDAYSLINMVDETDRQTLRESLLQAGTNQGPWHWTGKVRLASGRTRWLKGRSRPKKLANDTILWNGLLVDITESKQNEVKLQLFRNLINQSNDAIFVTDAATGKFLDVNERACTTLGYDRHELLAKGVTDIETTLPDQLAWERHVEEVIEKGYVITEKEQRRKNGSTFSVEMNIKYIKERKKGYFIAIARDITERKLAQKALKDKEKFLEQIINANSSLIFVKNWDGQFTMVNEAFAKIHGAKVDELLGKTDADFHPNAKEVTFFQHQDRQVIKTLQPTHPFENKIKDPITGKVRYFQTVKVPMVSENGLTQVLGIATDITERKLTSEEIQRQKTFYETFLNNTPMDLAVFDNQARYLYVNQYAIKNDEIRAWLIGKDDFDYYRFRQKDIAIAQRRREHFKQAVRERRVVEMLETMYDANGSASYLLRRFFPSFDEQGNFVMMMGYGLDLTDRILAEEKVREREQLLQSVNSNIQVGIFRCKSGGQLVYANEGYVEIFGYDSIDSVLANASALLFADLPDRKELMNDVDCLGEIVNRELPLLKRDGSPFWGLICMNKVEDKHGKVFYDGIVRDITQRKEFEELLQQKNLELEKTNSELDRFVYSASHELRAPLTSVLGLVSLCKMEQHDTQQLSYLTMMEQSVNRLDRFIQDIIHYSRNSRLDIQWEPIDFQELLSEVIDDLSYIQLGEKIETTVHVESPLTYIGDKGRIRIIFTNLISNAIRYHNLLQDNPYIRIEVVVSAEKVRIQVEDNGQGISQQHVDKIFNMFYRANNNTKGSGLGLYIVKETLLKLKGSVVVNSVPRQGTSFTLNIPNLQHPNTKKCSLPSLE